MDALPGVCPRRSRCSRRGRFPLTAGRRLRGIDRRERQRRLPVPDRRVFRARALQPSRSACGSPPTRARMSRSSPARGPRHVQPSAPRLHRPPHSTGRRSANSLRCGDVHDAGSLLKGSSERAGLESRTEGVTTYRGMVWTSAAISALPMVVDRAVATQYATRRRGEQRGDVVLAERAVSVVDEDALEPRQSASVRCSRPAEFNTAGLSASARAARRPAHLRRSRR